MIQVSKQRVLVAFLALIGLACSQLAVSTGILRGAEAVYSDSWHQLAGVRLAPSRVAIVCVDDPARAAHPGIPLAFWSPLFTRAIAVMRELGVRTIGFDILFSVAADAWLEQLGLGDNPSTSQYDQPFKEALSQGDVVLAGQLLHGAHGPEAVRRPVPDFYLALPSPKSDCIGLINLHSDADGGVRTYRPRLLRDQPLSFGFLLAVKALGQNPQASQWRFGSRNLVDQGAALPIEYCGPPGTFPQISIERLLAPGARNDSELAPLLAGKIVLVALGQSGLQDMHPTPYARSILGVVPAMMSGPEVHANIIESLLAGQFSQFVPEGLRLALLSVVLLLASWVSVKSGPLRGGLVACGLAMTWAAASYALFRQHALLPVAEAQTGILVCYFGALVARLTTEEKQRRKLQTMFRRYVSREIVDTLLAADKMPDLGGKLYHITVLFSDIRKFTTFSEHMPPDKVVDLLNNYFTQVSQAILEQGGLVDKFLGDGVMALFGVPVHQPDHALRAIRAALAIQAIAQQFRQDAYKSNRPEAPAFAVGVGLHTGCAVVGNIGSPERLEYTAVGDTVNVASRLEGLTKALHWPIVASMETLCAAGPSVQCGERIAREIPGREGVVQLCRITGICEQEAGDGKAG
ncbi:MAG: adenylate/guanylate cyclase domain-containing protein [Solidesulfovibrio sp.]|uniref:CHASE2 domain-containing protein n=2 Tax=Solidesulfovibrio sp. TaxID=2910990 RepID=UPI003158092B